MRNIYVRPLGEADKAAFIVAADASDKEFPKDVFTLPSTQIMVAESAGNIVMFQPHFVSLTLGSLIPLGNPSDTTMAEAQRQLVAAAYTRAHAEGFADVFASSSDERTRKFATGHGFTPWADGLRLEIR